MTATDELRRLLDERGVEWKDHHYDNHTWWSDDNNTGWHAENRPTVTGSYVKIESVLTPEQAIAATLRNGTCKMEQMPECQFDDIACSECGVALWAFSMDKVGEGVFATPNYCPYCGARVERREE